MILVCDVPRRRERTELELRCCGWTVEHEPVEMACIDLRAVASVRVRDELTAGLVMSRAVDGGAVLVEVEPAAALGARLVDALHHLERVVDRRGLGSVRDTQPPEVVGLLAALRSGRSVTDAATVNHVSRRTAYRLLEQCRLDLGVATVRELTLLADRLLPPAPD